MTTIADAVLLRLHGAVDPFYDGDVPKDDNGRPLAERYGVLYADPGARMADDLARTADRHLHRWQVTSVGRSREQVEWVAVRCRDALLDERLTASGWELAPVEHVSSSPIRPDRDIPGAPVFYGVDTYEVTATR